MFLLRTIFVGLSQVRLLAKLINYVLLTMEIKADKYALTRLSSEPWSFGTALLKLVNMEHNVAGLAVGVGTVLEARIEHYLSRDWLPAAPLGRKEKFALALGALVSLGAVMLTFDRFFWAFGCHFNTLS